MKNKVTAFALIVGTVLGLTATTGSVMKSSGPPSCNAGEPPNFTTCASTCHTTYALNVGTADIGMDLGGAEDGYTPGETYNISLSISKMGMAKAGFQFIAIQDNDNRTSPGAITITDANRIQLVDKNNPHGGGCVIADKVWVEHTYNGHFSDTSGTSSWSFQWTAPPTNVDSITFYLAMLEADNDLTDEGDYVYTQQLRVGSTDTTTTSLSGLSRTLIDVRVYPVPAKQRVFVEVSALDGGRFQVYNCVGLLIYDLPVTGNYQTIDISELAAGIYHLNYTNTQGTRGAGRFVKE
jgi:hypothetical protein